MNHTTRLARITQELERFVDVGSSTMVDCYNLTNQHDAVEGIKVAIAALEDAATAISTDRR